MANVAQETEITMRAKAFSSERAREYKMIVDTDGSVRVYDSVAGHYTRVHSLSDSAKRRARKLAAEVASVSRYFPRYSLPVEGLTADEASVLVESQGEAHELIEVTDVCATHGIEAVLYDAGGALRGYVHADGSYRLQ